MAATLEITGRPAGGGRPVLGLFRDLNRSFGAGGMPVVLAPNHLSVLEPVLAGHGVSLAPAETPAA